MAYISKVTTTDNNEYDIKSKVTAAIPYGECDSTSTATAFTATVDGITSLYDGVCVMLRNGVVTSASGFTININNLGAKPVYNNMATGNPVAPTNPTRDTTIFNINYTMLLVYDTNIVSGGGWICYRGYDGNTNTIGYQLRTNSSTMPMKQVTYRYRILFTALDGQGWVPSNTSTSTNATAKRDVNQAVIDPFGEIVYYGATASVAAGSKPAAASLWQEYTMTLGYAFNRTGAALVLPFPRPIYIKAAPQTGGGAIIDADEPYVFTLPSTDDGKIYIYLGRTYSATAIEITMKHPVYYYKDGAIREWTNAAASGSSVDPATASPLMDGTAAVGSSAKYAREDHVHPTDTSRQETLVSGTNIKTVNGNSLLGSGDLTVGGGEPQAWYAVSSTAADAAVKVATVSEQGFTLKAGSLISIRLTYGHSSPSGAATLKLNINETGDKQLYTEQGFVVARDYYLQINSTITVVYDGSDYILVSNTKPVNVVPSLESGVKIGSINDVNLYAPSGGGGGGNCVTLYGTNVSSGGVIYYDAEKTESLLGHFDYDLDAYKAYLADADSIRLIDGNKIYYPTFLYWDSGDEEWEMWIMVMSNGTLAPMKILP